MPKAYFGRRYMLSASHRLHVHSLSAEENRAAYGKCNNPNGHGHNYTLEVTVKGEVDPRSGFVVDLKQLKEVMHREVLDAMDHRFLNHEVPPFDRVIPTVENVAAEIWRRLEPHFTGGVRLANVRLYETEDLFVDYSEPPPSGSGVL